MAGRDQKKKTTRSDSVTPKRGRRRGTAGKGNRAAKRYANVRPRSQGTGTLGLGLEDSAGRAGGGTGSAPRAGGGTGTLGLGLEDSAGQGTGTLGLGLEDSAGQGVGSLGLNLEEARRRGVGDLDLELEDSEQDTGTLGLDLE